MIEESIKEIVKEVMNSEVTRIQDTIQDKNENLYYLLNKCIYPELQKTNDLLEKIYYSMPMETL